MSYFVYVYNHTGVYLSLNLLRSEVTGEQSSFQHTVQSATMLQTFNPLLKIQIKSILHTSIGHTIQIIVKLFIPYAIHKMVCD